MDNIPDEILIEILSQVPYSKQQHQTLALVDHRFNNVVKSGAFRAKAAHHRFPDFARLFDYRSLSAEQFADIAWREAKTEELLDYAIDLNEDDNTRRMAKVCIILIDYITLLNDNSPRNNSLFLECLKKETFDADLTAMLRYTLGRVFDLFYRQDRFWFVEIVDLYRGHPSDLVATLSADCEYRHSRKLNLIMMRAFETLVLTRTDNVSFLQSIFKHGMMDMRMESLDDLQSRGRQMFTRLAKIYVHVFGNIPLSLYDGQDYPDMYKTMQAFDWRPLSEIVFDSWEMQEDDSAPLIKAAISGVLGKEASDEGYYKLECTQTAGPWEWMLDIINLDFDAVGKAMRASRVAVKSGKVARAVIRTVDKITPSGLESSLRKLSLID